MWNNKTRIVRIILCLSVFLLEGSQGASLQNTLLENLSKPQHIALLLPLKGPVAAQASAVRDGFLTAFYQTKRDNPPKLSIIDTYERDIGEAYQEAIQRGADFVVGPLTKADLTRLVAAKQMDVPTLALNSLESDEKLIKNLFQFSLSPKDEAKEIATQAWDDQHKRFMVIAPGNAWGKGIVATFQRHWESLGGHLIDQFFYLNKSELNAGIYQLFHLDKAEKRALQVSQIIQEKCRFIADRRRDFDAIFLVANPSEARQIIPLLRFYYAINMPIYAISAAYSGISSESLDRDIEGLIFVDMPWILSSGQLSQTLSEMQTLIRQQWPQLYVNYARLYGLGVDAYLLIPAIHHFSELKNFSFSGASGMLHLLESQHIYRELSWARIENGEPHLLKNPSPAAMTEP
jgi:outer membrane PBP1 activator LpoA protein